MFHLVRIDEVDISSGVNDEVDLSGEVRVVLLGHPHVYQTNIA